MAANEREQRRLRAALADLRDDLDSLRATRCEMGERRGWDHASVAEIGQDIAAAEAHVARLMARLRALRPSTAA